MTLLFMSAPFASADPNDDAYLSALAANGITSALRPANLIQVGHAICTDTNAGTTTGAEGVRLGSGGIAAPTKEG